MRFIGDVHGKFDQYKKLIRDIPASIQVGDMGVGFRVLDRYTDEIVSMPNPPHDSMSKGDHYFIRGNHDNPAVCKQQKFWIPDGTEHRGVFCVGGGLSIDRAYRIKDFNYWEDEELTMSEFYTVMDTYEKLKPRVMVTHDCPESIANKLFGVMDMHSKQNTLKFSFPSITRQALDAMFYIHKPEVWLFGHWHQRRDEVINGTRFICLEELGTIDLEI